MKYGGSVRSRFCFICRAVSLGRITKNRHKYLLQYHIIFVCKYRKKLLISKQISDDIKQFWKGHTFWTDGYFACSVGNVSEEMLKKYIENQD